MNRKYFKKIVAMITTLAMVLTMNISAFADTIPVIDMWTFIMCIRQHRARWISRSAVL